ncbi:hypothetical protein BT93_D0509 [Corymbia citriodora subsp. variegata]|nr:hypothetical protein BT93_D0509 [Corymbia citriodora subsp. variegata]
MECDDDLYKTPNETLTRLKQGSEQQKCSVSPTVISNVLDLTGDDDDEMDGAFTSEPQDRKPLQSDFMIQSIPTNPSLPSTLNSGSTVTQLAQLGNNWPGFVQTPSTSNAGQEMQTHGGLPQLMSTIVTSAMAGVVPPAPAQDAQFLGNANFIDSMMQTHLSFPNNRHIQQSPVVNTAVGSEYGNMPSIPRHGTRAPAGMPALPARTQTPTQWQPWSMMPSGPSRAPQPTMSTTQPLDGFGSIGMQVERQQQISRPPVNTLQVSSIPPSALIRSSSMQDRSFSTGQSSQRPVVRPSPGQLHGRSRTSSGLFQSFQNHHLQQPMNPVTSPSPTHSPSMARPILPCTPAPVSQTPGSSRLWLPAQQPAMPAQTPVQSQKQPSRVTAILRDSMRASAGDQRANTGVHASSGGDGAGDLSAEQSWRPTRPMRGSITGRPHLDNNLNVIRPTQQAQATPPPSAMGVASPTVAPQLRAPNPIISSRSHLGYPRGTQ